MKKTKSCVYSSLYWLRDVEVSPDSKNNASQGDDILVKVQDLDGSELMRFIGLLDWVLKVRFSEDDNLNFVLKFPVQSINVKNLI